MTDPMAAEFDTVAEWTAEAALRLGPSFTIPAGCRGSGGPATLGPLLERLGVAAGDRMLDVGAGVGGPAGYAHSTTGVRPVLAEPQRGACRAARRLFDLPTIVADATALPFATAAFDVVWSLGVLCTIPQQGRTLSEIRRVLRPGGRVGLLVYVALGELPEQPEGNAFPTPAQLSADVASAGLAVFDEQDIAPSDAESQSWLDRSAAVDAELEALHGTDDAFRQAQQQAEIMGRLLGGGHVVGRLLTARAA